MFMGSTKKVLMTHIKIIFTFKLYNYAFCIDLHIQCSNSCIVRGTHIKYMQYWCVYICESTHSLYVSCLSHGYPLAQEVAECHQWCGNECGEGKHWKRHAPWTCKWSCWRDLYKERGEEFVKLTKQDSHTLWLCVTTCCQVPTSTPSGAVSVKVSLVKYSLTGVPSVFAAATSVSSVKISPVTGLFTARERERWKWLQVLSVAMAENAYPALVL